jgi:hypothetical protein
MTRESVPFGVDRFGCGFWRLVTNERENARRWASESMIDDRSLELLQSFAADALIVLEYCGCHNVSVNSILATLAARHLAGNSPRKLQHIDTKTAQSLDTIVPMVILLHAVREQMLEQPSR